jgi:hypothetical protein
VVKNEKYSNFEMKRTEVLFCSHTCISRGNFVNLYSLPNVIRIIKSRRMRWAGHIARMGER